MCVRYGIFLILSFNACTPYQPGCVKVTPNITTIKPGGNVSFVCETPMDISKFHWEIHNKTIDETSVTKLSDHSMQLDMNTAWVAEIFSHEANVLCMAADGLSHGSATIYFESDPNLECMMQNLDTMHCRWNNCDPRTLKHPESVHANYHVTYHTTHYHRDEENQHGNCNMPSQSSATRNCFLFCSLKVATGWQYWPGVEVRLDARNAIGTNTSRIYFKPGMNIILSPPTLIARDVSSETTDSDPAVKVSADFPRTVRNIDFFQYCEKDLVLEIRYKKISANSHLFEKDEEEDFWTDWTRRRADNPQRDVKVMEDSTKLVTRGKEVTILRLPANTSFLFQANWKYDGDLCSGRWSPNKFIKYTSPSLQPPKFYQSAMLYFNKTSSSALLFKDENMTDDSSLILWRHTDQSSTIYQNNEFEYRLYSDDEKCFTKLLLQKPQHFVHFDTTRMNNDCRMKVTAFNNLGNTSTPYFSAKKTEDNAGCVISILSMKVTSIQKDSLRFKVDWIYFSPNHPVVCDTSSIEGNITVALFVWEDRCEKCQGKSLAGATPTYPGIPVHSFSMDVTTAPTSDVDINRRIGFRTQPLNTSTLKFSFPFQPHTAYRIAGSLSWYREVTVNQSPAGLATQLFYHNVEKPKGITDRISCTNVGDSSMNLTWHELSPYARGGPILGYKIYITKTKECFSDGNINVNPHENCDEHSIRNVTYLIQHEQTTSNLIDGWKVENFSSKRNFSYFLDNLTPGTHHYVGIAAINAAGTSPYIKYVTQATKASRDSVTLIPVLCILGTFILLSLTLGLWCRKRHPIQGPVVTISLNSDPDGDLPCERNIEKLDTSCEYVDLFEEMKPLSGEIETDNNKLPQKIHPSDNSLIVDMNGIATYVRNTINPQQVCDHGVSSLSSDDVPCSSTGDESTPSLARCEYSDDGEEDTAIYASTGTALRLSCSQRWDCM